MAEFDWNSIVTKSLTEPIEPDWEELAVKPYTGPTTSEKPTANVVQKQPAAITPAMRFKLKTLYGRRPDLQAEYVKRKIPGASANVTSSGQVAVTLPSGEKGVVDPSDAEFTDVLDVAGDLLRDALVGTAAVGGAAIGAATPIPGASLAGGTAAGALTGAGIEAGLQATRKYLDPDMSATSEDIGEGGKEGAAGGFLGTLASRIGQVFRPTAKVAQSLELPPSQIKRLGVDKFEELGAAAEREGVPGVFSTVRGNVKKLEGKLKEVGEELVDKYDTLSETTGPIHTRDSLRKLLEDNIDANKAIVDPDIQRAALGGYDKLTRANQMEELTPRDIWELAKALDDKAGAYGEGSKVVTADSAEKAWGLHQAANVLRGELSEIAETEGARGVREVSKRYGELVTLQEASMGKYAAAQGRVNWITKPSMLGSAVTKARDALYSPGTRKVLKVGTGAAGAESRRLSDILNQYTNTGEKK